MTESFQQSMQSWQKRTGYFSRCPDFQESSLALRLCLVLAQVWLW